MKKFLFLGLTLSLLASCSNEEEFITTNQDSLFSLTSENALKICGGKSRILENENEEIIKVEIITNKAPVRVLIVGISFHIK